MGVRYFGAMEHFTFNFSGRARSEKLHGRDFLVVPVTMIVPGVLNGSQGALFYPPSEIGKNPQAWNGIPLTVGHPTRNGQQLSGRDPSVLNETGIGFVFHARTEQGKLKGEGWFDVEVVKKVDNRIHDALLHGRKLELSTGLFTENHPAARGATYNGKPYTHIARNYRPDHLAILPDQVGACSVNDGCGVNVNAAAEQPEHKPEEECTCGGQCDECKAEIENRCKEDTEDVTPDGGYKLQSQIVAGDGRGAGVCSFHRKCFLSDWSRRCRDNSCSSRRGGGSVSELPREMQFNNPKPNEDAQYFKSANAAKAFANAAAKMGHKVEHKTIAGKTEVRVHGVSDKKKAFLRRLGDTYGREKSIWEQPVPEARPPKPVSPQQFLKDLQPGEASTPTPTLRQKNDETYKKWKAGQSNNAEGDCDWVTVSGAPPTKKSTRNAFCPTGPGGGQDNSCGGKGGGGGKSPADRLDSKAEEAGLSPMSKIIAQDYLDAANGDVDKAAKTAKSVASRMSNTNAHKWHHDRVARFLPSLKSSLDSKQAESISGKHFNTETLKTRGSNRHDIHEVSVTSMKAALQDAYKTAGGRGTLSDQKMESIAKEHFGTKTLQTRGRDQLDFHSVSVASIRSALDAAAIAAVPAGKGRKPTRNAEGDCDWVTVSGAHVCVKGGEVAKGPASLKKEFKGSKKTGGHFNERERDKAARKEGYKNHKEKSRAEDKKAAAAVKDDKTSSLQSEFDALKKRAAAVKAGQVAQDGKKLTAKGALKIMGEHLKAGLSKAGALADMGLTKLLGKDDAEAMKNIPSDLKARFSNLLKKGKFTSNSVIEIHPITLRCLMDMGLVYNAFCPTGPGGGQDNSCGGKGGGGGPKTPGEKHHEMLVEEAKKFGGKETEISAGTGKHIPGKGYVRDFKPSGVWGGKHGDTFSRFNFKTKEGAEQFLAKHSGGPADKRSSQKPYKEYDGTYSIGVAHPRDVVKANKELLKKQKTENSSVGNRFHSARRQRLEAKMQGVQNMTREGIVDALVSNCDCFDEEDRDTLNSFGDQKLVRLYRSLIGNAMYEDEEDPEATSEGDEELDMEEEAPVKKKPGGFFQKKATANRRRQSGDDLAESIMQSRRKPQTAEEWFGSAPDEIKSAVQNAMKLEQATKRQLLERLTANVADDKVQGVLNSLKNKSIEELEGLLSLLPPPRAVNAPSFIGASVPFPGQTTNEQAISKDDDDVLPMPTINYAEEYNLRGKRATAKA